MTIRNLVRIALFASLTIGAVAPAFADDGWRGPDRQGWREHGQGWREHGWREHEWREHEWREHEWREHHAWEHRYPPPAYGYYVPPQPYYEAPRFYR